MTVSAVIPDPRKAKRSPDYIMYVRRGDSVHVARNCDRSVLDRDRAYLISEGAKPV